MPRIRFKNTLASPDRLTREVERFRQEARLAETAAYIDQWISSPGLKSPE